MLPEKGTYFAQLEGAVVGKGKSCSQFVLSFQVSHVSKNDAWVELSASFLRHVYVYLSDAAWSTSQKKLEALGFNGDFCNPNFTNVKDGVQLTCNHETYEGKARDKWELANWGGTEVERASSDIVRQLQAKWKAKANKPAPKLPSKPPAPQDAPPEEPGANDGPEELGEDLTPPEETLDDVYTGLLQHVTTKKGKKKNGQDYIRYGMQLEDGSYIGTFDTKISDFAVKACHDKARVVIEWEPDGEYRNAKSIKLAE